MGRNCKIRNKEGNIVQPHTAIDTYLDNNKNRSANDILQILDAHGVVTQLKGTWYLTMGKKGSTVDTNRKIVQSLNKKFGFFIRLNESKVMYPDRMFGTTGGTKYTVTISQSGLDAAGFDVFENYKNDAELEARLEELRLTDREDIIPLHSRYSELNPEEYFEKKKTLLKQSFNNVGIDVDIVENKDLPTLGAATPGTNTIEINPDLMKQDTLIHEFGHIYIDLLGEDNPTVLRGIEKLKKSKLWDVVSNKYPELEGIRLGKEVLATSIGIEGAQVFEDLEEQRLWKILLNKLFRLVGEIFNRDRIIGRKLAKEMLSNDMRSEEMLGTIDDFRWESRGTVKLDKIIEEARIFTEHQISIYERRLVEPSINASRAEWKLYENKKQTIQKLGDLNKVLETQDIAKATNQLIHSIHTATINGIAKLRKLENLSKNPEFNDIQAIVDLYEYVTSYKQILDDFKTLYDEEAYTGESKVFGDTTIKTQLLESISSSDTIARKYFDLGIPILADYLLKYTPSDLNESTQTMIKNIEEGNRGIAFKNQVSHLPAYKELVKAKDKGKITQEEFAKEMTGLVVNDIKNKHLITRESLIKALTVSSKDVSSFSMWLDPLVYSNDITLDLFGIAVKNKLYEAQDVSREDTYKILGIYDKYKDSSGKSTRNVADFNDDIIEEIEESYYDPIEEKEVNSSQIGFVQPFLVSKFKKENKEAYKQFEKEVAETVNITIPEDPQAYSEFMNTIVGKRYRKAVNDKYGKYKANRTQATPGAQEIVDKAVERRDRLRSELNSIENKIAKEPSNNIHLEQKASLELEIAALQQYFNKNIKEYRNKFTPKGDLVMPSDEYRNPKWLAMYNIDGTPKNAAGEYHKNLLEFYWEKQALLPQGKLRTNSWDKFSYWTPTVKKDDKDALIENNIFAASKEIIHDTFKIRGTDTEYNLVNLQGEEAKMIPIWYTNAQDAKHVSKDIPTSLVLFAEMANEYKAKASIAAEVNLMRDVVGNREVYKTNSKGEVKINALAKKLGYNKEIFKTDEINAVKHLDEFLEMNYWGNKKVKAELNGVDLNKASGLLVKFSAIMGLAGNALQGVNNITLGKVLDFSEAVGGQFYNKTDWAWSGARYWQEVPSLFQDMGKPVASSEFGQIIDWVDPIQGSFKDSLGHNVTGSQFKKFFRMDRLFFMQQGGEHMLQVRTMLSMMHNFIVKDSAGNTIPNDEGKPMNLREAIKKNTQTGKIEINKDVANFDINQFRNRLHGINGKLHGKFNAFDQAAAKRRWWGGLGMLFRTWIVPGLRRRYGHGDGLHSDIETGIITEGTYQSFWRYMKNDWNHLMKNWNTYSPLEKANIRKTAIEFGGLLTSMALVALLGSMDWDDDDNWIYFILYQLRRLQSELFFYLNPAETWKLLKSPTATITTIQRLIKFGDQLTRPTERYDRRTGRHKQGDLKIVARATDVIPLLNNLEKSLSPVDSYNYSKSFGF